MSNLLLETRTYREETETHYHLYGQLIMPLIGRIDIATEHQEVKLDENHIFFLPTGCSHTYSSKEKNQSLIIDIPDKIELKEVGKTIQGERFELVDEKWQAIKFLMIEEMKKNDRYALRNLTNYALHLLNETVLPKSIEYLIKNYDKRITVKFLAEIQGYNPAYYTEWFFKQTGYKPSQYIQNLRLEKGKEYLESTDMTVAMIAMMVGYEQQSSFNKGFKRAFGLSPIAYRNKTLNLTKNK